MSAVVRPRSPWEAIDLGFVMARHWFKPMMAGWLVVVLPIFLLLQLFLWDYGIIPYLIIWWLKPLWERLMLFFLSRRLFGESMGWREQLRYFLASLKNQAWQSVTYRRFSFTRSFDLPIILLEELKGAQRGRRLGVLHRSGTNSAVWLTIVLIHAEMIISIGAYTLLYLFIPQEVNVEWLDLLLSESSDLTLFGNLSQILAMSLIAPFYVAAGFALYLNRRTELEGWDIEIIFKQLQQRSERRYNKQNDLGTVAKIPMVAALAVALASFVFWDAPVQAQEENNTQAYVELASEGAARDRAASKQHIEEILTYEDFNETDTQYMPKFLLDMELQEDADPKDYDIPEWLFNLLAILANSVEIILWGLFACLLAMLIYHYRHWLMQFAQLQPSTDPKKAGLPTRLFGLDVGVNDRVDNVGEAVRALWQSGDQRGALSLLYRETLIELMHVYRVAFRDSFTEGECQRLVRKELSQEIAHYFDQLSKLWINLAYAGKLPADDKIFDLLSDWEKVIATAPAISEPNGGESNG